MCTVTYVYSQNKSIITSNRDEHILRPKSIVPKMYMINGKKIFFPKDPKAGGTWYAVDETGNVIVLLNGGKEKHLKQEKHTKSRGLVVLEIISAHDGLLTWEAIALNTVEPFTLVYFTQHKLFELIWDGIQKHTTVLDPKARYIWSSVTLYPEEIRKARSQWFFDFLATKENITAKDLLYFHQHTETENKENGLVINRNETLLTQSITQTKIHQNKLSYTHLDLLEEEHYTNTFLLL